MIRMRVSHAAEALGAQALGGDTEFVGASIDSRRVEGGQLFVALRGSRVDGHDFAAAAFARGAAAAMLERPVVPQAPTLLVENARAALARLAADWRRRFPVPLVAVTGSNGKTTVKEMIAAILRVDGPVLATRGNLNNELGVPLTLLELDAEHERAVLELGANRPGEIAALAGLVAAKVGVVTGVAPAHLEGFGSIDAVARTKGELFEHLLADGTAVINADDAYAGLWQGLAGTRSRLTFGLARPADVSATWCVEHGRTRMVLLTPEGSVEASMALLGRHNVMKALAASAAALAVGASVEAIRTGLARVAPIGGRLEPRSGRRETRIIDDTYNANPGSLRAALEVLAEYPGAHWLVLGDMAELGANASDYHREAGTLARVLGVERLFAIGEFTRETVDTFGEGGQHFASRTELAEALADELAPEVTVLVKGSRSMRMEEVIAALLADH